jgi:hypothetical protein
MSQYKYSESHQAPTTLDTNLMDFRIIGRDAELKNSGLSKSPQERMHF